MANWLESGDVLAHGFKNDGSLFRVGVVHWLRCGMSLVGDVLSHWLKMCRAGNSLI